MLVEDALQMTNAVILIICLFFESEASRKSLFNPDRFTSTQARGQRHAPRSKRQLTGSCWESEVKVRDSED